MKSLNQLFFFSFWGVHIFKVKVFSTKSRAVHSILPIDAISVVQVNKMPATVSWGQILLSNISKHPRHRCLTNAKFPGYRLQIFIYKWYHI